MSTITSDLIDKIHTEYAALDAITAIKAKFDLAGTVFCTADVDDMAAAVLEDHPLANAYTQAIVEQVKASYGWRKMGASSPSEATSPSQTPSVRPAVPSRAATGTSSAHA